MENKYKRLARKSIIILGWLAVWQLVCLLVNNSILITGPIETLKALALRVFQFEFWQTVLFSMLRISTGFFAGIIIGVLLAVLSVRFKLVEEIFSPAMALIKAVPVASFVVLFLIWWHSENLAAAISFCVVLPNVYVNTLEGIKSTDKKLLEMARVYHLPLWNKFFYIYRPALKPFLDSSIKVTAGMSWKAGIAAEVIGTPDFSIGEKLYMSKIHLDTAGLFAWTIAIIIVSVLFEKAILYLWKCFVAWEPECKPVNKRSLENRKDDIKENRRKNTNEKLPEENLTGLALRLKKICKKYNEKLVISDLSAEYFKEKVYYFTEPSGSGKTTLFRLMAGLETADSGEVQTFDSLIAYMFQEDRLCEEYSALKNIEMVTGSRKKASEYLEGLLVKEDMERPCCELSGGMKRKVALARACSLEGDVILLDEPFTGLDGENIRCVNDYIKKHSADSALLIATHIL